MNMKSLTVVWAVLVACIFSLTATAQVSGLVEAQTINSAHTVQSEIDYKINKSMGLYTFIQTGPAWRQMYVGPTFSPVSWMQMGAGLGMERAADNHRFGSFAWLGKGPVSFLAIYEDGGTGPWHKMVANYAIGRAGVGIIHQAFLGFGPRAEFHAGKFTVWGAYCNDGGKRKQTIAISRSF